MNSTENVFHLRTFRHSGEDASLAFTATLAFGKFVVAKISGQVGTNPFVEVAPENQYYWGEFQSYAATRARADDAVDEPAVALLMDMADHSYHARRLQVTSLRYAAYRLRGDAPGSFRYLRGRPYDLKAEGELRLTFGRRLEEVFRRGSGADLAGSPA